MFCGLVGESFSIAELFGHEVMQASLCVFDALDS
nr:MAG TPA: hypothetical protein [Caudoviricetes sp.]